MNPRKGGKEQKMVFTGIDSCRRRLGVWLPPRDSNPDMLIQSQLSCR